MKKISFINDDTYSVEFTQVVLKGSTFFVPKYSTHRPAVKAFLKGSPIEPKTYIFVEEFFNKTKGSMVHAGTFFGDMLPSFSQSVNGTVYAFEPVLENYVLAKMCIEVNKLENIQIQNCALSNKFSNLYMSTFREGSGGHAGGASSVTKNANIGTICSSIPIDSLNCNDIALIQLDVEGHELIALEGAKKTIKDFRPVIAIEDHKFTCDNFLKSLDYEQIKTIPGLKIWSPIENAEYKNIVLSSVN